MKRIWYAVLALVLLTSALCGCSAATAEQPPAAHEDPIGEYEALAAVNNTQGIVLLIEDLAAVGDFEHAAAIVNAEYAASRYPLDMVALGAMFAGHEDAVVLEAWTGCYNYSSPVAEKKDLSTEMSELYAYNAAIRRYFEDDWSAFKYVLENANRQVSDLDSVQLARCGTAPNGKALVYFRRSVYSNWMFGASAALPIVLIPSSLDEVEYLIVIDETRTPVGTYTNGEKATRLDYIVSLIHYPSGEKIYESNPIQGGSPPRAINENQSGGVGDPPDPVEIATELETALARIEGTEEE